MVGTSQKFNNRVAIFRNDFVFIDFFVSSVLYDMFGHNNSGDQTLFLQDQSS